MLTMRLHRSSLAMPSIPAAVELRLRASFKAPKLSPLISAPDDASTESNVTATINRVRYPKDVWWSDEPFLALTTLRLVSAHVKWVYLTGTQLSQRMPPPPHGEASKDIVGRLVFLSLLLLFFIVLFNANAPKSSWAKASLKRVQNHFAAEEKRLAGK